VKVSVQFDMRGNEADDWAHYLVQAVARGTSRDDATLVPEETQVWLTPEFDEDDPVEIDLYESPLTGETLAKWIATYGAKAAFGAFQAVEMYPDQKTWIIESD
jgi:hypothetical protein